MTVDVATAENRLAVMSKPERVAYLKANGWTRVDPETWASPDGSEMGSLAWSIRRAFGVLKDRLDGHRDERTPAGPPIGQIAAVDLIAEGQCSALCLLAREEEGPCQCRCRGQWHAALADAAVEAPRGAWWELCGRVGWSLAHCAQSRTDRDDQRLWQQARQSGQPACWVRVNRAGMGGHTVLWDGITMGLRGRDLMALWPRRESLLLGRITHHLLTKGRVRLAARAPGEHLTWTGLRNLDEARTLALIVGDCFSANPAGAVRAIEVLEGRPDPVALGLDPESGYPDSLAYDGNPASSWHPALGEDG